MRLYVSTARSSVVNVDQGDAREHRADARDEPQWSSSPTPCKPHDHRTGKTERPLDEASVRGGKDPKRADAQRGARAD